MMWLKTVFAFALALTADASLAGCPPAANWPLTANVQSSPGGYQLVFGPEVFATTFPAQNIVSQIIGGTINITAQGQQLCDIGTPPPPSRLFAELGSPPPGAYTVNLSVTFLPSGTVRTGQFRIVIPNQTVNTLSGTGLLLLLVAVAAMGAAHLRGRAESS